MEQILLGLTRNSTLKVKQEKHLVMGLAIALSALAVLIVLAPAAFAQGEGEIYQLMVSPEEPIVGQESSISVGVKNPTGTQKNYKLEFVVSKHGQIKYNGTFSFTLRPGMSTLVSPTFVPDDIGSYDVVAKLTDQFSFNTYDLQLASFNAISNFGPFDIILDIPSDIVTPRSRFPMVVTFANMGTRSTDIQARVSLDCYREQDIVEEFYIFMPAGGHKEKIVALDSCDEVGPHYVTASILAFNKSIVTAVSQIFLNTTQTFLLVEPPSEVKLVPGVPRLFDVRVTNLGERALGNIRVFIPKIPQDWIKVVPYSVEVISPSETIIFLINVTPPTDAEPTETLVSVSVSSDQALEKEDMRMIIVPPESVVATGSEATDSGSYNFSSALSLGNPTLLAVLSASAAAAIVFVIMRLKQKPRYGFREKKFVIPRFRPRTSMPKISKPAIMQKKDYGIPEWKPAQRPSVSDLDKMVSELEERKRKLRQLRKSITGD